MKKLLFFVLIALILGSISAISVEEEWEKAKSACKKVKEFLKKYGIYEGVVSALNKGAKAAAQTVCEKKLPKALCTQIVYAVGKLTQKIPTC